MLKNHPIWLATFKKNLPLSHSILQRVVTSKRGAKFYLRNNLERGGVMMKAYFMDLAPLQIGQHFCNDEKYFLSWQSVSLLSLSPSLPLSLSPSLSLIFSIFLPLFLYLYISLSLLLSLSPSLISLSPSFSHTPLLSISLPSFPFQSFIYLSLPVKLHLHIFRIFISHDCAHK